MITQGLVPRNITGPTLLSGVGAGGSNSRRDTMIVQNLLNGVPANWGGPRRKLDTDGVAGPKTIDAIFDFQEFQVKTVVRPDGRVDPQGRTFVRLHEIATTDEVEGSPFFVSQDPVVHIPPPAAQTGWAAAAAMLRSSCDRAPRSIESVLRLADSNDPDAGYLGTFRANQALPTNLARRLVDAIGGTACEPANFSIACWKQLLQAHGAIGLVRFRPTLEVCVLSEMFGDGSAFGTFFTIHDPLLDQPYAEVFATFAQRFLTAGDDSETRVDQIWFAKTRSFE